MTKYEIAALLEGLPVGGVVKLDSTDPESESESATVERRSDEFYGDTGESDFSAPNAVRAADKLAKWGYTVHASSGMAPGR